MIKNYIYLQTILLYIFCLAFLSGCNSYEQGNKESLVASKADSLPEYVDFNIHIKPILSDRCFVCHGPDANNRKANLRLDTKEGAFSALGEKKDHYAIVAGDPEASELYNRLITTNKDEVMPVPASNLKVSDMEIALVKKWIEQGAEWKQHWSFISAKKPEIPKVKNTKWPVNPIDNFILAKIERENLKPSAETDKETLIRRVSLDLTGLPPTIQEVDAFLADKSPKAYEHLIDRYLASPAYGERMAADWMDVARYADSHGYQDDGYRNSWFWRDWVINAYNKNMPFDQFTTWQIAGDLLPNATKEQKLATSFNRNHPQNQEGGIVEEEYRVEYVLDRTNTVSKAFLGLTMECSRCHDHKYDPLTQKEYYQFSAFFNQNEEAGQISNHGVPLPTIMLADEALEKKLNFVDQKILEKKKELDEIAASKQTQFEHWQKQIAGKKSSNEIPDLIAYFPLDKTIEQTIGGPKKPEQKKASTKKIVNLTTEIESGKPSDYKPAEPEKAKKEKPAVVIEPVRKISVLPNLSELKRSGNIDGETAFAEGKFDKSFEFKQESSISAAGIGDFDRTDRFSFSFWANALRATDKQILLSRMLYPTEGWAGYEVYLSKDKVSSRLISLGPSNGMEVTSKKSIALNSWTHIAVTYDGSSKAAGLKIFINGEQTPITIGKDNLYKSIRRYDYASFQLGTSAGQSPFNGGKIDEVKVFARDLTAIEVATLAGKKSISETLQTNPDLLTIQNKKELYDFYLNNYDKNYQKALSELQTLREEQNELIAPVEQVMVMEDRKIPRETFLLMRGAYDAHGEKVNAGTPKSVGLLPKNLPKNRLGLAKWLMDPKNPLVSRVTVNRYWQQYFGAGIVTSSDDFGSQGTLPTHPELLDWLSTRFIESGWDIKAMQKLIVMSATYRQSSKITKELLAKDPQNLLYARGPRQRMPFEMVRDNALVASNLLTKKVGGPSVRPYQPEGLWEEKTSGRFLTYYHQDHGENLYRRSLYTFFKRTSPPPTMMTFDAPERNACYVRRRNTNTPLQALVTLNDKQFIEAARVLAERMMKEGGTNLSDQITFAYRAALSRYPSKKEIEILSNLYNKEIERFNKDNKSASGLLTVGEYKADTQLNQVELAANAIVASTILNLDETITKQ